MSTIIEYLQYKLVGCGYREDRNNHEVGDADATNNQQEIVSFTSPSGTILIMLSPAIMTCPTWRERGKSADGENQLTIIY